MAPGAWHPCCLVVVVRGEWVSECDNHEYAITYYWRHRHCRRFLSPPVTTICQTLSLSLSLAYTCVENGSSLGTCERWLVKNAHRHLLHRFLVTLKCLPPSLLQTKIVAGRRNDPIAKAQRVSAVSTFVYIKLRHLSKTAFLKSYPSLNLLWGHFKGTDRVIMRQCWAETPKSQSTLLCTMHIAQSGRNSSYPCQVNLKKYN